MAHFIVAELWLLVECAFSFAESRLRLWLSLSGPAGEVVQELKAAILCWCRLLVSSRQVLILYVCNSAQGRAMALMSCNCGMTFVYNLYTEIGLKPTKVL